MHPILWSLWKLAWIFYGNDKVFADEDAREVSTDQLPAGAPYLYFRTLAWRRGSVEDQRRRIDQALKMGSLRAALSSTRPIGAPARPAEEESAVLFTAEILI